MELRLVEFKPAGLVTIAEVAQIFGRSTLTAKRYLKDAGIDPVAALSRGDRGRPTHLFVEEDVVEASTGED
jgi:hypothetical protein